MEQEDFRQPEDTDDFVEFLDEIIEHLESLNPEQRRRLFESGNIHKMTDICKRAIKTIDSIK